MKIHEHFSEVLQSEIYFSAQVLHGNQWCQVRHPASTEGLFQQLPRKKKETSGGQWPGVVAPIFHGIHGPIRNVGW